MEPFGSPVPVEIINSIRPFIGLQWPALVLPEALVHETCLVDDLPHLAPRIPRKSAFPGTAETPKLKRLPQPLLNLLQTPI